MESLPESGAWSAACACAASRSMRPSNEVSGTALMEGRPRRTMLSAVGR